MYILQLMDDHIASYSALFIGLAELNVIVWVFGVDRFLRNGQLMLGNFPMIAPMWKTIWMIITPTILAVSIYLKVIFFHPLTRIFFLYLLQSLLMSSICKYTMPSYGHYRFPDWCAVVGWILSLTSVIAIPIVAFYKILTLPRGGFLEVCSKFVCFIV